MTPEQIHKALTDIEVMAMDIANITKINGYYADTIKDARKIEALAMQIRAQLDAQ